MKPLVLIVEDEAPLVALLRYNLEKRVLPSPRRLTARRRCCRSRAAARRGVARLDAAIGLGHRGVPQIRRAPATRSMPVIMLTARGEERPVRGSTAAPTIMSSNRSASGELVARLRAVIRRAQPNADEQILRYADVTMDLVAHRVSAAGSRSISARPNSACCSTSCTTPPRLLARTAARPGVEPGCRDRAAHRRCPHPDGCARRSTKPAPEICCAPCGRSATPSTGSAEQGLNRSAA